MEEKEHVKEEIKAVIETINDEELHNFALKYLSALKSRVEPA